MEQCGVCNFAVDLEEVNYHMNEKDGTVTPYHFSCGEKVKKIKPCSDCSHHRLLCNECREQ